MVLRRLAVSNFLHRKVRVILTVAAIALSVSLVVSVTSGYASVEAAARKFLAQFLGSWDALISRPTDPRPGVDSALVQQLREDPNVRRAVGRLEADLVLLNKNGDPVEPAAHATVFGINRALDDSAERLKITEGRWFTADEPNAVVIDQGMREKTGAGVG